MVAMREGEGRASGAGAVGVGIRVEKRELRPCVSLARIVIPKPPAFGIPVTDAAFSSLDRDGWHASPR